MVFWQAIRWKILLPRRYRVAAWIIGFFLGAVVGTALDVETLLSGAVGAFAFESAVEFWWWRHNRHRQMVAEPSGANELQSRLTRSPKNATSNGYFG